MVYVKKGYKRKIDLRQAKLLYDAGLDFAQIAAAFGVTRQAAHACLVRADVHRVAARERGGRDDAPLPKV